MLTSVLFSQKQQQQNTQRDEAQSAWSVAEQTLLVRDLSQSQTYVLCSNILMHCAVIFDTSKDRGACPPHSSLSGLPFTQVEEFIVHNPSNNRSSQNPCHYRQGTFQPESYLSHTIQILTNMIKIWLSKWKPRDGNKKNLKGSY